jgi:hypothetical protein
MNRFATILVILLLSSSAFAQQSGPRNLAGRSDATEQESQTQLQSSVIQLYVFNLKNEVGLTEEQFIKARPVFQRFIRMRFQNATQRKTLDERQMALLSRPDASEADLQKLNQEVTKLDGQTGTWEGRMIQGLQSELADRQLSERQIAALRTYNRRFFTERLPGVLEQMRANPPAKGRQRPEAAPGNQNPRNQTTPNTLRGNKTQPPVQPRKNLAR